MRRCTKCILPENYPLIEFDANGVCNFCNKPTPTPTPESVKGKAKLEEVLAPFRNKGKWDCIVALSGGRDSTYLLHYVVTQLGLHPLTLTVDHGLVPEQTKQNIHNAVNKLGVDHVYIKHNHTKRALRPFMLSWMKWPDPAMIAFLCNGCVTGLRVFLTQAAFQNNTPLIISGHRGEPALSFANALLRSGPRMLGSRLSLLWGAAERFFRNPSYLQHPALLFSFAREGYYRLWHRFNEKVQFMALYEYIRWEEAEILRVIGQELNWRKPDWWPTTWRSDCKIHFIKEYLYKATLGFTKQDDLLSGLIRHGIITRDDALKRLTHDNEIPAEIISQVLAEHDLDMSQIDSTLRRYREKHGI